MVEPQRAGGVLGRDALAAGEDVLRGGAARLLVALPEVDRRGAPHRLLHPAAVAVIGKRSVLLGRAGRRPRAAGAELDPVRLAGIDLSGGGLGPARVSQFLDLAGGGRKVGKSAAPAPSRGRAQ